MYTSLFNVVLLVLAGAATGVVGAMLGTGGGVFLVPLLVLGFGVPIHYAVATSIVTVIATSSAVASANVERGTANMRLGMTLETATASGAILGGLAAGFLSAQLLEGVFAFVLVPTAALMWRGRFAKAAGSRAHRSSSPATDFPRTTPPRRLAPQAIRTTTRVNRAPSVTACGACRPGWQSLASPAGCPACSALAAASSRSPP